MTQAVFDSSAVVAVLLKEHGWEGIQNVIKNPDVEAILAGPALAEAIYVTRSKGNQSTGAQIWGALSAFGVRIEHTTDADLLRAASLIELSDYNHGPKNGTLSLGDALILAVGERLDCLVITRDGYWKWMSDNNFIAIKIHIA